MAGGITTNFVDSSDTLGSATGDLAGGLGVHVFNQEQGSGGTIRLTVQHHWVTVTGETVSLDQGARGYLDYLGMADFIRTPWSCVLCYALVENGCVLELPYLNNDLVMLSVTRPFSKSI